MYLAASDPHFGDCTAIKRQMITWSRIPDWREAALSSTLSMSSACEDPFRKLTPNTGSGGYLGVPLTGNLGGWPSSEICHQHGFGFA